MTKMKYSFMILPYLTIEKEFTIGGCKLFPFNTKKIRATDEVKKLSKMIVRQYKTLSNRNIEEVTFVHVESKNFGDEMTDDEKKQISDNLKVLFLIAFRLNQQMEVRTSDNFEPIIYDVEAGSERISTKSGGIHELLVGGYFLKNMKFTTPTFMHTPFKKFSPLPDYIVSLEQVLTDPRMSNFIRAVGFFFQCYMNDERIPQVNKITNLYLAFLSLMRALPGDPERDLWHDIMFEISDPSLSIYDYPIINTKTGRTTGTDKLNIAQIWGDEFYKLRCRIIHGDQLTSRDYLFEDISGNNLVQEIIPHFYMGANVFFALFFHKLSGLVPNSPDFVISDRDTLSLNPTGLGFGNPAFKLPMFITDLSLMKKLSSALHP